MNDYELDASELEPPKPYTQERAEEIAELINEISGLFNDILNMDRFPHNQGGIQQLPKLLLHKIKRGDDNGA